MERVVRNEIDAGGFDRRPRSSGDASVRLIATRREGERSKDERRLASALALLLTSTCAKVTCDDGGTLNTFGSARSDPTLPSILSIQVRRVGSPQRASHPADDRLRGCRNWRYSKQGLEKVRNELNEQAVQRMKSLWEEEKVG